MANSLRYAIYYAAAPGSELDRFGANLLGYDAWSGEDLPFPDGVAERMPDWRDLTQDPRKYGFHATLKAPLALGRKQDRGRACCSLRGLRGYAADNSRYQARGQFHQRLHRGGARATDRPNSSGWRVTASAPSMPFARR